MKHAFQIHLLLVLLIAPLAFVGCGTPAAPSPPSLNLPQPVENLSASRSGDVITFTWTQPRRNTDRLFLKDDVDVVICHKLPAGECEPIHELTVSPNQNARVEVTIPQPLATGEPRITVFAVQSLNHLKRAAGLSNEVLVITGAAPPKIESLKIEEQRQGIVLRWKSVGSNQDDQTVRLIRHRTSPLPVPQTKSAEKSKGDLLTPAPEPEWLTFLVDPGSHGQAVDRTTHTKESYEYRAERLVRMDVKEQNLELKSAPSEAVSIDVKDDYAPQRPRGLAAVAASSEAASQAKQNGIDLSWQPVVDEVLASPVAGYVVYRRIGEGEWQRISGSSLVVGPAFHDADVKPGTTYNYSVTAVGANTLESPRSEPASESVEESK